MKGSGIKLVVVFLVGISLGFGIHYLTNNQLMTENKTNGADVNMTFVNARKTNKDDKRVFLNASENRNGNTSEMAKELFGQLSYTQINLVDYSIPQIGEGTGDFDKVFKQISQADVLVIGTPVYWSNMSGYLKTFIDHMEINDSLKGTDLYVIVQGSDSNQDLAVQATYGTLNRISMRFNMNFIGLATNNIEISDLRTKLID